MFLRFTPGERAPGTHWIGGWVGPRAGLDDVEKRKLILPQFVYKFYILFYNMLLLFMGIIIGQ
jgi:hypothetical protein